MGTAFEVAKVVGAIVGLMTGIYVTYWQIRQKQLSKDHGLEDNPERCGRHEEAIKTLQVQVSKLDQDNDHDHDRIFHELGLICVEIAKINRNGGAAK